ncbi:MAG: hypothetical protein GYA31_00990 [Parcubacteria group bacterium]|nr:hypothetical protein [Parcubacteria group bacterium]
MKTSKLFFIILISLFVFSCSTNAAEVYLKSSQDKYSPNEIFKAEIRLNVTPGENVTAIEGKIKYNPQDLKAVEFLTGNSILTFVDQPKIDENNGFVSFSGIIPGGYTGRLPGDPGESNLLGTIAFQVLKTNNPKTTIQVANDSRILVDAGQELKTNLIFKFLDININPQEVIFNPLNELELSKESDKIPPEEFTPEIIQTNNQYFVAFNTQDKQSGIDHYDLNILERNFWGKLKVSQNITNITSPYPLTQEDIKKPLQIIAFDKAGNERKALLNPLAEVKWYQNYLVWGIIIVVLIIFTLTFKYFRKYRFPH